ncbi:MAG: 50S ribosomal protein L10 [Bacteroidetes bacterium]|nr:50S ribosomal protein L10 [Bacteroidota bacterium]
MNKTEKQESVAEIKEVISNASAIFLVDYKGVNVDNINKLRKEFIKEGITYKVFKNSLAKRAFAEIGGFDKFNDLLVGMTGFAFVGENFVSLPKIIKKQNDEKKNFEFKGCYIDAQFFGADQLETLSKMPTKEEIMSGIIGSIAAPASNLVGVVSALHRDIVSIVDQISKQKAA